MDAVPTLLGEEGAAIVYAPAKCVALFDFAVREAVRHNFRSTKLCACVAAAYDSAIAVMFAA